MLKSEKKKYYQVKEGQTLRQIAAFFCVSEFALAKQNSLAGEPFAGQILALPSERGNAYVAHGHEEKRLLCGSEENYYKKNGTACLYPGMRVIL